MSNSNDVKGGDLFRIGRACAERKGRELRRVRKKLERGNQQTKKFSSRESSNVKGF